MTKNSFICRAVNALNGREFGDRQLKVELAMEKKPRRGPRGPGAPFGGLPGQSRQTDFPLRILVQSDMVCHRNVLLSSYYFSLFRS